MTTPHDGMAQIADTVADPFGVFILRDGRWCQWTTGFEYYVRGECRYLRDCLGVNARVFRRVAG